MNGILNRAHGRISRAPLSFGFACIGVGMLAADMLSTGLGLSSLVVGNIGAVIIFAGMVFLDTNCREQKSDSSPQGE